MTTTIKPSERTLKLLYQSPYKDKFHEVNQNRTYSDHILIPTETKFTESLVEVKEEISTPIES